jgi:hypothetical protein
MDTIAEGGLILLVLLGPTLAALAIRRRIPHRPTLGAWIVVGSVIVAMIASIGAAQWRREQLQKRSIDRAIERLRPIP